MVKMIDSEHSDSSTSVPTSPSTFSNTSSKASTASSASSKAFTSNLQVLLQKQGDELEKNLKYKKKIEEEEEEREAEIDGNVSGLPRESKNSTEKGHDCDKVGEAPITTKYARKKEESKKKCAKAKEKLKPQNSQDLNEHGAETGKSKGNREKKKEKIEEKRKNSKSTEEGIIQTERKKSTDGQADESILGKRKSNKKSQKIKRVEVASGNGQTKEETKATRMTPKEERRGKKEETEMTPMDGIMVKKDESTGLKAAPKEEAQPKAKDTISYMSPVEERRTQKDVTKKGEINSEDSIIQTTNQEKQGSLTEPREERDRYINLSISSLENASDDSVGRVKEEHVTLTPPSDMKADITQGTRDDCEQDAPKILTSSKTSKMSTSSPMSDHQKKSNGKMETSENMSFKEKRGILFKKGNAPFSSWKKYYFVLDGKRLMYYQSENDYKGLQGAKGSLDLAELENVEVKKQGKAKLQFPFSVLRRGKKTANLAAETEKDREDWVKVIIRTKQIRRMSVSQNVLDMPVPSQPKDTKEKSATMPMAGVTLSSINPSDDSSSNESKVAELPQPEQDLIQPKKVARIGIGIPLDLSNVKLKKVDKSRNNESEESHIKDLTGTEKSGVALKQTSGVSISNEKEEKEDEKTDALKVNINDEKLDKLQSRQRNEDITQAQTIKPTERNVSDKQISKQILEDEDTEEKDMNSAHKIGIKLKKTSSTEILKKDNTKKNYNQTGYEEDNLKKSKMQPKIPLNKRALLSYTEAEISRAPPDSMRSKRLGTKRSPSPNIPLSKGVQSVIEKSAEEVKESSSDIYSKERRFNDQVINTAETIEIRYSDEELDIQDEGFGCINVNAESVKNPSNNQDTDMASNKDISTEEIQSDILEIPYVSVTVKDESDEKQVDEEFDEELLRTIEYIKEFEMTGKSTSSKNSDVKLSHSDNSLNENSTKCESKDRASEKDFSAYNSHVPYEASLDIDVPTVTDRNTLAEGTSLTSTASKASPRSPLRKRSATYSSSKTDAENTKKLSRKLKRSKSKCERNNDEVTQEESDKEKKKKKSSLSKILSGKRGKEKKLKAECEESLLVTNKSESQSSPSSQAKAQSHIEKENEVKDGDDESTQKTNSKDSSREEDCDPFIEFRINHSYARDEVRCSNYSNYSRSSNTSRDPEPPPLVPEKRGNRAKSPAYDIPQSNQPVTGAVQLSYEKETDHEITEKIDGIISQDQINAILNAKETSERRKQSITCNSGGLLALPDYSLPLKAGNEGADDITSHRPSYQSVTSTESDEPLPKTNFLHAERLSDSSGSIKGQMKSDESESASVAHNESSKSPESNFDSDAPVVLRQKSHLKESRLSVGARVSLTSPEFTVMEEDRQEILSQEKIISDNLPNSADATKPANPEDDELNDFFPNIGGDDDQRLKSPIISSKNSSTVGIRTSGIVGLKAFLEENEEELPDSKSGISRLGHSAAIEMLKRASADNT